MLLLKKNKTFNYDHFQANRKYNDQPYTHHHNVFQQDSNFQAVKRKCANTE